MEQVRCTYCGYVIPNTVPPIDTGTGQCCSRGCASALEAGEQPFSSQLAFKRRPIGVKLFSRALPAGIPSYATILAIGEQGTRLEGLLLEIIWRALERGEPAVIAPVDNPATAMIDAFLAHGWNVLPYLDREQFRIIDMYTGRLKDRQMYERRNDEWSKFLLSSFGDAIVQSREPSDLHTLVNHLDQSCERLGITQAGVVLIDDLTELASWSPDIQAINFLKEIRGVVSKARDVPLFAGASRGSEDIYPTNYPRTHEYLFDGIIELELNDSLIDGERIKRASVRKMDDVPVHAGWYPYEFNPNVGFVPIDPFIQ